MIEYITLDNIRNSAKVEARAVMFNYLRKFLKEEGFTIQRIKDMNPDFRENNDVLGHIEYVTINGIPMYYKDESNKGSGIKFNLAMIKVEMPQLYEHLYSLFKIDSPEFISVNSLIQWFNEHLLHLHNNPKLKIASKIGVFENSDYERESIKKLFGEANTVGSDTYIAKIIAAFEEYDLKAVFVKKEISPFAQYDDVEGSYFFNVSNIPIRITKDDAVFKFNEKTQSEAYHKTLLACFYYINDMAEYIHENLLIYTSNKLKDTVKMGVFEKIKTFKDFDGNL